MRKQFAFLFALGITAFVVVFWLIGVLGRSPKDPAFIEERKGPIATIGDVFGALILDVSRVTEGVRTMFSGVQTIDMGADIPTSDTIANDGI